MGLLDKFEQRVDRMVNGAFARAFKSEVQPVELAASLQRELDDRAAIVSRGRTVVPNSFTVALSDEDFERLSEYAETLEAEFAGLLRDYAQEQRYTFLGPVSVLMINDSDLDTGMFLVRGEAKAAVTAATPTEEVGSPYLVVAGGRISVREGVNRIGRGPDADIRVDDPGVSRLHAELTIGPQVTLRDAQSTNGTFVNGVKVSNTVLHDGATIRVGSTSMTFRSPR